MIYGGHSYHLDDLCETVAETTTDLRFYLKDFDFIVVTGISGCIVGAPVAVALDKPLVVVRKPDDNSHDNQDVINYAQAVGRWIFLDDFVATGRTLKRVRTRMAEPLKSRTNRDGPKAPVDFPVYAGSYMYHDDRDERFTFADADDDYCIVPKTQLAELDSIESQLAAFQDRWDTRNVYRTEYALSILPPLSADENVQEHKI